MLLRYATWVGYRVQVRFNDGRSGVVELSARVVAPDVGVFAALRDPEVFAGVHVHYRVVTCPGEIDLAQEAMYEALRCDGEWILN